MAGKRPRYDDAYRASAVLMLQADGYPNKLGALTRVAKHLSIPERTLRRWYKAQQNPPPDNVVRMKKGELTALLRKEIYAILGEMDRKRDEADYRELATALGIAVDKLQLLAGEPTENARQRIVIEYDDQNPTPAPTSGTSTDNR